MPIGIHVPESILRRGKTLREVEIGLVSRSNVRNPPRISMNRRFSFKGVEALRCGHIGQGGTQSGLQLIVVHGIPGVSVSAGPV